MAEQPSAILPEIARAVAKTLPRLMEQPPMGDLRKKVLDGGGGGGGAPRGEQSCRSFLLTIYLSLSASSSPQLWSSLCNANTK